MKAKDHLIDFFCCKLMVHVIVNIRKWVNQRYTKLSNCLILAWQECFGPFGLVIALVQPGKIVGNDVTTFGAEFAFELRKKLY